MEHHFNIDIATKYGINIAIFLNNMGFWVQKNQANNKHFQEGRYWTYNSSKAFCELFPYWSADQMDRLIKKCVSLGLLLINNFNETTYDRTRWYGLTDNGYNLLNIPIPQNRGMDPAESRNGSREIAEPIPDHKPDHKPERERERESLSKKSKKVKSVPLSVTSLPLDFEPNEQTQELLMRTSERVSKTQDYLLSKFKSEAKARGWERANWQAALESFLKSERPSTSSIPTLPGNSAIFAPVQTQSNFRSCEDRPKRKQSSHEAKELAKSAREQLREILPALKRAK